MHAPKGSFVKYCCLNRLNGSWCTRVLAQILSYWECCYFVAKLHIQIGCLQLYLTPLPLTSMFCIFNPSVSPSCCLCKTLASSLSRVTQHVKFAGSRIKVKNLRKDKDRDNKVEVRAKNPQKPLYFDCFLNTGLMYLWQIQCSSAAWWWLGGAKGERSKVHIHSPALIECHIYCMLWDHPLY